MSSEKQYTDLYEASRQMIFDHAAPVMNAVRDKAFDDFCAQGFLRGGGIIEVNQRLAVHLAGEYGEIGSYLINIKHRFLCS